MLLSGGLSRRLGAPAVPATAPQSAPALRNVVAQAKRGRKAVKEGDGPTHVVLEAVPTGEEVVASSRAGSSVSERRRTRKAASKVTTGNELLQSIEKMVLKKDEKGT